MKKAQFVIKAKTITEIIHSGVSVQLGIPKNALDTPPPIDPKIHAKILHPIELRIIVPIGNLFLGWVGISSISKPPIFGFLVENKVAL